jgi:gamma-glutamyltranspeptidase / glutathione hydrolase
MTDRMAKTLAMLVLVVPASTLAARPFRGGAIATAHPAATEAGLEMLQKGGNATDAAVAAAFTMGVVGPYHSGIGGGGFALVHDAAGKQTRAASRPGSSIFARSLRRARRARCT